MASNLTQDEREEISGGIEHEGIGYWVMHYGYKGDDDPKLKKLCEEARKAMDKLTKHLEDNDLIY